MPIQRININSTLDSIIMGKADGSTKQYLLTRPCKKEIDYFVYFAYVLESESIKPYVRVNYEWEYGQRARRIDLVGVTKDKIILYKKTNKFNTDSNALDLVRIKEHISTQYSNLGVDAVLIYTEDVDNGVINDTISSLGLNVTYKKIL